MAGRDLLEDVLLRLPVESLVHFKCMCKHWYALITSPSFVEMHYHHKHNHAHVLICKLTLMINQSPLLFTCSLPK